MAGPKVAMDKRPCNFAYAWCNNVGITVFREEFFDPGKGFFSFEDVFQSVSEDDKVK